MATSQVTLRQLLRHTSHTRPSQFSLRSILKQPQGALTVGTGTTKFTMWVQNMGLLNFPAIYLGWDRDEAIVRLIAHLAADPADVVGLCEVYSDSEREFIRNAVIGTHPYYAEGPTDGAPSDGALLLLSRHPILPPGPRQMIFNDCEGFDCLADKGALHIRIQIPGAPTPCDVIFSHAQSISEVGGLEALFKQMTQMGAFLSLVTHPDRPAFIMGDLNIPGEREPHHEQMIERLGKHAGKPVDLWLVHGKPHEDGMTFVAENNFYEVASKNPRLNHRLDYILMKPGKRFVPIVKTMNVMKLKVKGHDLSDHFGLRAEFENHIRVGF